MFDSLNRTDAFPLNFSLIPANTNVLKKMFMVSLSVLCDE